MKKVFLSILFTLAILVGLFAVFTTTIAAAPDPTYVPGAVFTMTNAASGNAVVMYNRWANGSLTWVGTYPTKGDGYQYTIPDPLGSQNSLMLTKDGKWLLAVNAGSSTITVFQVNPNGLKFADQVCSGGMTPVSLTISGNEVFVLNDGDSTHLGNITGFNLGYHGDLDPIWDSTRWLPVGGAQDFGQVGFDNSGNWLVVTDKADSNILVYRVWNGMPSNNAVTYLDPGVKPFSFIFDVNDHLLVVEAADSAVSSYGVMPNGMLKVISSSVINGDSVACWIAENGVGPVFTTNPGGPGTIASYKDMVSTGKVTLENGSASTSGPVIDEGISNGGQFLYALSPNGNIYGFKIAFNGDLTSWGTYATGDISGYVQGIAVR